MLPQNRGLTGCLEVFVPLNRLCALILSLNLKFELTSRNGARDLSATPSMICGIIMSAATMNGHFAMVEGSASPAFTLFLSICS